MQGYSSRFANASNESGAMMAVLIYHSDVGVSAHGIDCEIHIASSPINYNVFYDSDHRKQSFGIAVEMHVVSPYPRSGRMKKYI